ncbi:Cupin [Gracilaria domingensis]|nr:Cupin [Gracilaria domingensis]
MVFVFTTSVLGSIPSFGTQTNGAIRGQLADNDFRIRPEQGVIINNPNFRVRVADLSNFPALAGQDVQAQITRVTLKAMQPFIPHYHPRGVEVLNAIRGSFRITFKFEGLNPRTVTNIIHAGESTVFPQGLMHETVCISKRDCEFLSTFNSADPGFVPVNL